MNVIIISLAKLYFKKAAHRNKEFSQGLGDLIDQIQIPAPAPAGDADANRDRPRTAPNKHWVNKGTGDVSRIS